MSRLLDNIKSDYFKAINSLKPKKAAKTIMIYVENEDDISRSQPLVGNAFCNALRCGTQSVPEWIPKQSSLGTRKKQAIDALVHSVNRQLMVLKTNNPDIPINSIAQELEVLGVNPDNTYC
ncbi:MAG: hypothetical protein KAI83_09455 [Thiomargarita sp.]|nr:hypothetical protein [Thiomargarita sp.]